MRKYHHSISYVTDERIAKEHAKGKTDVICSEKSPCTDFLVPLFSVHVP